MAAGLLLIVSTAPLAHAQYEVTDEGLVFGKAVKRQWLTLDNWSGALSLSYTYSQQESDAPTDHQKAREQFFDEQFTLSAHGYILHPNLIDFNGTITLDLQQRDFQSDSTLTGNTSDRSDGVNALYNFHADILRAQILSYYVDAQRTQTLLNRDFGPTLIQTSTLYAAGLNYRHKTFPTQIQVSHAESDLEDPADQQGFQSTDNSFIWSTTWNISPNSHLSGNYLFSTSDQQPQLGKSISYQTNQLTLIHLYNFGPQEKNSLESTLDYYNESGEFASERWRYQELLTLEHSDRLRSYYRYTYNQDAREEFDHSSHQFEAGFRHRLYNSLNTSGAVGYTLDDASGESKTHEIYTLLNFDYTKQVPLGNLGLNLSLNYDFRKSDNQGDTLQLFNQPFTFTDPLGIVINRRNVDPNSIIVRSTTGRLYTPILDYTVNSFSNRTQIQRVLGGAIPADSAALVDYTVLNDPSNTQQTYGFGLSGSYNFTEGWARGLSVYAHYIFQNQDIQADNPEDFIPDNIRDKLIGAKYRIGPFIFTAEQQWHDSTLAPYEMTRFDATYAQVIRNDLTASLSASYNMVKYTGDEPDQTKFLSVTGSLNYNPSNHLSIIASAGYRDNQDELFGDTKGFEEQLQVEWTQRQTKVQLLLRNVNLEEQTQDANYQAFQIVITRSF